MRARVLLSLALLVPLGFYSKFWYRGPAQELIRSSAGGVFYVAFWSLAVALVAPRARASIISVVVLAATCAIEFLQLWHPPALQWARSFFVGRTILGTDFEWRDFPFYFLGAPLGWLWLRAVRGFRVRGNAPS